MQNTNRINTIYCSLNTVIKIEINQHYYGIQVMGSFFMRTMDCYIERKASFIFVLCSQSAQ